MDPRHCARFGKLCAIARTIKRRKDTVEIDQLPASFAGIGKLRNRTAAAYLQALM